MRPLPLPLVLLLTGVGVIGGTSPCFDKCQSGDTRLTLESCGMTDDDIPDLVNCLNDVGRDNIEELYIIGNDLTSLPLDIFEGLTNLKQLSLGWNELSYLPVGLFDGLGELTDLFLGMNELTTLHDGLFTDLLSLERLYVHYNKLTSLPPNVFYWPRKLSSLFLHHNQLTTLPAELFNELESLTVLGLKENPDLQCVPANGAAVVNTDDIDFDQCECTPEEAVTCPEGLHCTPGASGYTCGTNSCLDPAGDNYQCTAKHGGMNFYNCGLKDEDIPDVAWCFDKAGRDTIKYLSFSGDNRLTTLPADILHGLVQLTYLKLDDLELRDVPRELFDGLEKIEYLFLRNNQLASLPELFFKRFADLNLLGLTGNNLSSLSRGQFAGLGKLEYLFLSDNELTTLPEGLFDDLGSLIDLFLWRNPGLQCVPASTAVVRTDDISLEQCGCIPEEAIMCDEDSYCVPGVTGYTCENKNSCLDADDDDYRCKAGDDKIILVNCGLVDDDIPDIVRCFDEVGRDSIEQLFMFENRFTTLPGDLFQGLASLTHLHLDQNNLSGLSPGLFLGLQTLTVLSLENNSLSDIPQELFSDLRSLHELNLGNNELRALLPNLFNGPDNLGYLNLAHNQLTTLPEGFFYGLGSPYKLLLNGNPNLQCVPANGASVVYTDDISFDQCGCSPYMDVRCEQIIDCVPGERGYSCEKNGHIPGG